MNVFTTCCRGQRLGVFAGSGVGKSVLLSMLARTPTATPSVVGLDRRAGPRGPRVHRGDPGRGRPARAVVVVATSDEPALKRRQAAYMTLAIAEFLRDQDLEVLCLMDSVTRFAMAQREIGLAAGEPPTTKGYTPTVFTELPKLLERAGPGRSPDGTRPADHRPLHRAGGRRRPQRADRRRRARHPRRPHRHGAGHRRARPLPGDQRPEVDLAHDAEIGASATICAAITRARQVMATYANMEELIRIGAYRAGSSEEVDEAIRLHKPLEAFLSQHKDEATGLMEGYQQLVQILGNTETES